MKNRRFTALFLMIMLVSSLLTGCQDTNDNYTTESVVSERFPTEATVTDTHSAETSTTEAVATETFTTEDVTPETATTEDVTPETATPKAASLEPASTESSTADTTVAETTTKSAVTETTATRSTAEATTEATEISDSEPSHDVQFDCPTIIIPSVSPSCPTIESTTEAPEVPTIESTTEAPEVPTTEAETESETDVPTTSTPIVSGSYSLDLAKEAFDILNQYRADAGLPALTWSDSLYESSKVRAKEIKTSFSHTRPDGTSCFTVFSSEWYGMGENIYYGTGRLGDNAETAMTSWYNSDGHRANMLNEGFNHAALACYYENGAYYWVTLFGFK